MMPSPHPINRRPRRTIPVWTLAAALCVTTLGACETHDIGFRCPQLLGQNCPGVVSSGGGRAVTLVAVRQDIDLPCEELICAAADGKAGYCSRKCRSDEGCPAGFECRVLVTIEGAAFYNEGLCVWKSCTDESDCLDGNMSCRTVVGSDPGGDLRLCDYTDYDAMGGNPSISGAGGCPGSGGTGGTGGAGGASGAGGSSNP